MHSIWSSATLVAGIVAGNLKESDVGSPSLSMGSETTICSRYVWRGLVVDRSPALQSSTDFALGSYSFNFWSTSRASRASRLGAADEIDFTLSKETGVGNLTLSPGLTYYAVAGSGNDTAEAAFSLGYDADPWYVYFDQYLDVMASGGAYFATLGVGFERETSASLSIGGGVALGWANTRFHRANIGVGQTGFSSATVELFATWRVTPWITLRPSMSASSMIGRRVRRAVEEPDNVVFGLAIGLGG